MLMIVNISEIERSKVNNAFGCGLVTFDSVVNISFSTGNAVQVRVFEGVFKDSQWLHLMFLS